MPKRKCTQEDFHTIVEVTDYLAHILAGMGIVEYRFDQKRREIYWDTSGGGMIDPERVEAFANLIENHFHEINAS